MVAVYDVYDHVREGDDKIKVNRFWSRRKCTPATENPGYAYMTSLVSDNFSTIGRIARKTKTLPVALSRLHCNRICILT